MGIPPGQRAFLGRWRAGVEVDTNSYVLTSRQIVHAAQEKVAWAFCTGDPQFSETEVFDEMRLFAKERGLEDSTSTLGAHRVEEKGVSGRDVPELPHGGDQGGSWSLRG